MKENSIIVIGGGAAGIMAAISASKMGKEVVLIEKNNDIGKKLSITGGGRCNITNICEPEEMIKKVVSNGKFLYSALNTFSSSDLMKFIEDNGIGLKIEEEGKVFPKSDCSSDIIELFKNLLYRYQVKLYLGSEVKEVLVKGNRVVGIKLNNEMIIKAKSVIVATGGMSYSHTGSTGDGYRFAKLLGHTIIPPKPSLTPIEIEEEWVKDLMGISLPDVIIRFKTEKNKKIQARGSLLFTHYGISGPVVLEISAYINQYLKDISKKIKIDLLPDTSEINLEKILLSGRNEDSNKTVKTVLSQLLPKKLNIKILSLLGISEEVSLNQLTKKDRNRIIQFIKNAEFTVLKLRGMREAIVTSGGVSVKEINSKTMESKLVDGLYFAGEVIDIDALTGGYNLQIAFSTGYIAGINA